MDIHGFVQSAIPLLTAFGLNVIGAIVESPGVIAGIDFGP